MSSPVILSSHQDTGDARHDQTGNQVIAYNGRSISNPSSTSTDVNFDKLNSEHLQKIREFFINFQNSLAKSINSHDRYRYMPLNPYTENLSFDKDGSVSNFHPVHFLSKCLCITTLGLSSIPCYFGQCKAEERTEIPEGIKQFAIRTALGLSFIFHEIIAALDTESNKQLSDYFVSLFTPSLPQDVYFMLMRSISFSGTYFSKPTFDDKNELKTVKGSKLSFYQITLMGVRTIEGGKYEPIHPKVLKSTKELNLYRWGTSDFINAIYLQRNSEHFIYRFGDPCSNRFFKGAAYDDIVLDKQLYNEFWRNTDNLAKLFLTQTEFQTYVQQIPVAPTPSNYPPKVYQEVVIGYNYDSHLEPETKKIRSSWKAILEHNNFMI